MPVDWQLPIKFTFEFPICEVCGEEAWCPECGMHAGECWHPGPDSEPSEGDRNLHLALMKKAQFEDDLYGKLAGATDRPE